ncbi:MAG: rRNA pseudouridine synthase [Clostridiales bacterium]|nr:rRNA pseudouridine synthase [Clostridiales bacterium]
MRINKFLAECGIGSRRACDKIIEEGRVKINGKVCGLGDSVDEFHDSVTFDGKKLGKVKKYDYYIMNKPKGCVCTVKDDKDRKTVMDYLPPLSCRIYPVGRLDYDSEGLLIFTNDGDLANRLTHPSNEIPKTYLVKIEGQVEESSLAKLRNGVVIDGKKTKKSNIKVIEESKEFTKMHVTITEGRNREIRKMFETVGKNVVFLKRIKIGDLALHGLDRGECRKLTPEEVDYLKNV